MRAPLLSACACALVLSAACGARTGLLSDQNEGQACKGPSIAVTIEVPDLYFALDHSGSMKLLGKWPTMRSVVSNLMTQIGPRARLGATMFPGMDGGCEGGQEVLPLTLGDSHNGVPGPHVQQFLTATDVPPSGGTPTAATLSSLLPKLKASKHPFLILATDGGPNCNTDLMCGIDRCIANIESIDMCLPNAAPNCCDPTQGGNNLNCLDDARALDSVNQLYAAGVSTFVIGVPGSDFYGPVLDALAAAGHTAKATSPKYYRVDSADAAALESALADIAAKVTHACSVALDHEPVHPEGMSVSLDGAALSPSAIDGFTVIGTTLSLHGTACTKAAADDSPKVVVTDGCVP